MRVIILGLGVQGRKRLEIAGDECVAVVDPFNEEAPFKHVSDVPLTDYDAALVCTPDEAKIELLRYLLGNKKHVLVEKPLLTADPAQLQELNNLAETGGVTCYTAYNHRFEPHFAAMQRVIEEGRLGKLYTLRMFYGNGTARLVRDSAWRDQGAGVLPDLGSHLLDTLLFWTGKPQGDFRIYQADCFENRAPDFCAFGMQAGGLAIHLEMTLLSWRNHFYADILAEKGSAHIQSLCKWGPSTFTLRDRKLPSGRPDEQTTTLVQPDPTWALEYAHFKKLCESGEGNIINDMWINEVLARLSRELTEDGSK
ncbi:MAG: Gfo/Idh/MocA family oxidoreductase [Acidobacteriota bacterium]|nr:Gfo/Idh/MocA family oxidoreductase [Acidobacteriota bacterium]